MNEKKVLLFSGGIDSYIAWHYLNYPDTLYIDLGHKYNIQEYEKVCNLIPNTKKIELTSISKYEKEDADIPLRNLYLAMIAVNEGYDKIWIIIQKEEMSIPDRKRQFLTDASNLLSELSERKIIIDTPFENMDKVEMITWYKNKNYSIENLMKTWACYHPEATEPCGNCGACMRRFVAMKLNNINENWHDKIYDSDVAKLYKERAEKRHYSEKRSNDILKALKK
jgi:7-cyano-7-deazaguanine synthase